MYAKYRKKPACKHFFCLRGQKKNLSNKTLLASALSENAHLRRVINPHKGGFSSSRLGKVSKFTLLSLRSVGCAFSSCEQLQNSSCYTNSRKRGCPSKTCWTTSYSISLPLLFQ